MATQHLNAKELQIVFIRAGVHLNDQELVTLFRTLDPRKTGKVKLTRVLKFVVDNVAEF